MLGVCVRGVCYGCVLGVCLTVLGGCVRGVCHGGVLGA